MPDSYVRWLRERIGHRKVILAYVTTLITDERGWLLWQRRSDFDWWGLPGGVVEIGEDFTSCARREAQEETGLHVEPTRMVGVYAGPQYDVRYPNGDEVQQCTVALACRIVGGALLSGPALGAGGPDGQESTGLRFFPPERPPADRPRWYTHMAADLARDLAHPTFEPPRSVAEPEMTIYDLREEVGAERMITVGAAAIICDDAGRVLLNLRADSRLWGIPAGLMELGETPSGAMVREVREELGIDAEPVRLIGAFTGLDSFHTYSDGNRVQIVSIIFSGRWIAGDLHPDGVEALEAGFFDPADLPPMLPRHARLLQAALQAGDAGVFQ